MNPKVISYLRKSDPVLYRVLSLWTDLSNLNPTKSDDYFLSLVKDIVNQQLSGKAAVSIYKKLENLFPQNKITPKGVLKLSDEKLRSAGLSYPKVRYLKDLADQVLNNKVDINNLDILSDEDVIIELTKIKGIGRWTAQMFLMFALGREDVFSEGDLGLRNAIKIIYELENPTTDELMLLAQRWSPYRTYACKILWRSLNNR